MITQQQARDLTEATLGMTTAQQQNWRELAVRCHDRAQERVKGTSNPADKERRYDAVMSDFYLKARAAGWVTTALEWERYVDTLASVVKGELKKQEEKRRGPVQQV